MDMDRLATCSPTIPDAATQVRNGPGYTLGDPRFADIFTHPLPTAAVPINEDTALNLSAVWSAVRVITSASAILPLNVYKRRAGSRVINRVDNIKPCQLAEKPCPEMSALSFWEMMLQHALVRGNAYAEIERNGAGEPVALWPLLPNYVGPYRDFVTRKIKYQCGFADKSVVLDQENVFHLSGLGYDGIIGYSVIAMARRSMKLTASSEQAGDAYFSNGMKPSGWVEDPRSLADIQKDNVKENMKKEHAGAGAFGKGMYMWGGMKYHPIDISPNDAQFLETRQFQVEEVARWFNVPPHKIKHLLRSTFSNIEQQNREFYTDTLLYWLTKITQEFQAKLLSSYGERYFAEFDPDILLSGDVIARYTAYGIGRQWGFLSPNDCRAKEGDEPIEGGDVYHVAVNMAKLGSEPTHGKKPPPDKAAQPNQSAAFAVATAIARELCDRDSQELIELTHGDRDLLAVWMARATTDDWGWVADAVRGSFRAVGHLSGRDMDLGTFAAMYAKRRASDVVTTSKSEFLAFDCGAVAAEWRSDHEVAAVRDLILMA